MRFCPSQILIFISLILFCLLCSEARKSKDEDFSEFDDFDQDEFTSENPAQTAESASSASQKIQAEKATSKNQEKPSGIDLNGKNKDEEVTIDDDDDEAMFDEDEFETSDSPTPSGSAPQDLKITEVPENLRGNRWEAYQCEAVMVIALLGYLINFLVGRAKNARLANLMYQTQHDLLVRNFQIVGDDGQTKNVDAAAEDQNNKLLKESENLYVLWCTGRVAIESMLMELRFIKRQCVFNSLAAKIKSINDMIVYTIDYSKEDMDTYVFCLARKRSAIRLHRDMNDLSQFCAERKNAEKRGVTGNYQILSEIGEVSNSLIDNRVADFIDKFPDALEYIHISDQYSGLKALNGEQQTTTNTSGTVNAGSAAQQQDALNTSQRSVRRVLIVGFNLVARPDRSLQVSLESLGSDYLRLVLHLIDRVANFRLPSKESKSKAIKNRQRIEEQFLKNVIQQRQEQAQQRREEKRRAEKEKIMQSDDSDLQRKWEEKEHKRELKRQKPKMKQMKIKAM